jgi:choline dehydrogenase-like flavoprotein
VDYDVMVSGGRCAGWVLANRLSAADDLSVLLVETGPHYSAEPDRYGRRIAVPINSPRMTRAEPAKGRKLGELLNLHYCQT